MTQLSSGLGTMASICIMIVVIGCFSVLWSFIYYPMLKSWRQNEPEQAVAETMLPPKVREAMKLSPVRDSLKSPKRTLGRPSFHMDNSKHENPSQGTSIMNLFMPVYTVAVAIFFLFIVTRMGWKAMNKSDEVMTERNVNVPPKCNCSNMHNYPKKPGIFQRNRDSLVNTATYRALTHLGEGDPSKTMDSFLNDMETFRNHLALAREIKSKLEILEQDSHKKEVDDTLDETNKQKNEESSAVEQNIPPIETAKFDDSNVKTEQETEPEKKTTMLLSEQETTEKDVIVCDEENGPVKKHGEPESKCMISKNKARRRRLRKSFKSVTNTENLPPLKDGNVKRNKKKVTRVNDLKTD